MKKNGVPMMVAPERYPGVKYYGRVGTPRRYAFVHNVVWWQKTGNLPRPGYVISHKNGNVDDNRFENLFERVKYFKLAGLERPLVHGTVTGYRMGCRCEPCKTTNTIYYRKYRQRLLLAKRRAERGKLSRKA